MDRLIDDFLQDLELSGKTKITALHYGYCLKNFCTFLDGKGKDISSVDKEALRGFIEKQAEDPLPSGGGMNAVPTTFETEAKSISS